MNFFEKLKIARLMIRVIALQSKAPKGTFYNIEYHGSTNEVDFWKFRKCVNGEYTNQKHCCCYLGEDYGLTLDEVARQIAIADKED